MAAPLALVWDLIGRDHATVTFDRVGASAIANAKRIDSMTVATERAGGAAAGQTSKFGAMYKGLAALATIDVGVHLVHMAADFEYQMNRMVTAAGESQKNLKTVSDGVLNLMGATGTGAKDLEKGLYQIESAGYHGAAGLNILKVAAQGAKIENANLGDVANAVTSAMVDYHLAAGDAASVMNTLIAATAHGKTTTEEMALAVSKVGAAGATAHVPLADLTAAIATMTMHGTDAAVAGTYLRQVIGQLEGGSAKARLVMSGLGLDANQVALTLSSGPGGLATAIGMLDDAIQKHLTPSGLVAVETFKKSSGSLSDFQKVLGNIPPSLVSTFSALSNMTGGVKSLQGFLQLGGENLQTFKDTTDAVNEAVTKGGKSVEGWAATQKQLSVQLDMLRHGAEALGIRLGEALIPAVQKVIEAFKQVWAIARPLAMEVGGALTTAWHVLADVLHAAGAALGVVGRFAKSNQGIITDLGVAVLATFAAFKGITLAVTLLKVLDGALLATQVRVLALADSFTAVAAGMKTMSLGAFAVGLAAIGFAGYEAGNKIASIVEKGNTMAAWMNNNVKQAQDWAAALRAANGALNDAVRASIGQSLQQNGVAAAAAKAGISLRELETATYAGGEAATDLLAKWVASGKGLKGLDTWIWMTAQFNGTKGSVDALNGSLDANQKTAYGSANAAEHAAAGTAAVAAAMKAATDSATSLTDQMTALGRTSTQSDDAFMASINTFSKSAGAAADRASLIGATLKEANGDALNYASAMIGAASANTAFVSGFQGDVDKIAGLKQQISDLYAAANAAPTADSGLATAQMTKTSTTIATTKDRIAELNAKINSGKLSAAGLAAAHRSLANAQASLGVSTARLSAEQSKSSSGAKLDTRQLADLQKQLADAYKNSEKAAIQLSTGAIDFKKGGAPALVAGLQAIQDSAVKAASALYQHELATKGGKRAADDAYNVYVTQTKGALIDEAAKLGITQAQAKKLADRYFGMPKSVKTLIEQEGANPVVDVLNKLGRLLASIFHRTWDLKIDADTAAIAAKLRDLNKILGKLPGGSTAAAGINKQIGMLGAREFGGPVTAGVPYIVGEKRPEIFVPEVNGRIHPRVPTTTGATVNNIAKQELHVHYPMPGNTAEALPNLRRMFSTALEQR